MRGIAPRFGALGILAVTSLLTQACATQSGSSGGDELRARAERIEEPMIKDIPHQQPSQDLGTTTSRTNSSKRAELSARNTAGPQKAWLTDVLFDFDRSSLRVDALPALEANAQFLRKEGVSRLLLEGRGDEVGTSAYNLVLGHSRARHVKAYLQDLGIPVDIETISYGKDHPLCFEQSGDCRQMNRSVRFSVKE